MFTLAPELCHYSTAADKRRAWGIILRQFRVRGVVLSPRLFFIAVSGWILLQFAPLFVAPPTAAFALSLLSWVFVIAILVGSGVSRARPALRRDLIRRGTLVCLACGYDLQALSLDRCPECGADCTDLPARAWEAIPEMTIYPELSGCRSAAEAEHCLLLARARAGPLFYRPRITVLLILLLTVVGWIILGEAIDGLAHAVRRDIPPALQALTVPAFIASLVFVLSGWYLLVIRQVSRHIPKCIAELRRTPPPASTPEY
jgi:hypothetical protein